jgi:hypothetical protein
VTFDDVLIRLRLKRLLCTEQQPGMSFWLCCSFVCMSLKQLCSASWVLLLLLLDLPAQAL